MLESSNKMLKQYLELKNEPTPEAVYMERLSDVLTTRREKKSNDGPVEIVDHLYCGNQYDARNPVLLRRLHITHILNCAPSAPWNITLKPKMPYDPDTGVLEYMELDALDNPSYPVLRACFEKAKKFIDRAGDSGGRALVHCELGVNRSVTLCVAYLVDLKRITLIQAVRQIQLDRPNILTNEGFRLQLIEFANDRNLLHRKTQETSLVNN